MKINLIPKLKHSNLFLKFSFFIILNIIICIFIFKNFSYINNKCDIIISNIFYFIIIFSFLLFTNLIYVLLTNLFDKKTFNLCLTILTISTIIILILTLYLKNQVDVSKLSEVFYNFFLQLKIIKIVWNQQELVLIGQQYVIEKSYKISQEMLLNLTKEVKNPEELIEKLNLIYTNTLKETTILNNTLNFLYNHKFKILIGTGLTVSAIAVGTYIIPILVSKFAVAPIIEAVQENPIIEIGVQENPIIEITEPGYITAFKTLDGSEQAELIDISEKIKVLFSKLQLVATQSRVAHNQVDFILNLETHLFNAWANELGITERGADIHIQKMEVLNQLIADVAKSTDKIIDFITLLS